MPKTKVSDLFFYKHRYLIGFVLFGLVFASILCMAQLVTGGLSNGEMTSAVLSNQLADNPFSKSIVNFPFRILQWASVSIFGLTVWSIKLPAIILAALSGIAVIFLLKRWSKLPVVLPAAILILTSSQFLFSSQDGSPSILYILLPVLILLFGHIAGSKKELNLSALLVAAALLAVSLYTPLLIYFVTAIILVCLIHPRTRLVISTAKRWYLYLALAVFTVCIVPLVVACVNDPSAVQLILTNGATDINLLQGIKQFVTTLFFSSAQSNSAVLVPVYGLPLTALVIIGFIYGLGQRHRTKYYMILGWLIISVTVMAFDPSVTALVFAPLALLLTKGLAIVIQKWYDLFPSNPYARVAGLAPISFLIVAICSTSVLHFMFGYHYAPQVTKYYNNDITLIRENLASGTVVMANGDPEYEFYKLLEKSKDVTVVNKLPTTPPERLITIGKQKIAASSKSKFKLERIVTSGRLENANRLYIYE
jgi:hypothetical protein